MIKKWMIVLVVLILAVVPFLFSEEPKFPHLAQRTVASTSPAVEQGEVWGPRQEEIAQYVLSRSIETSTKISEGGIVRRDAHSKQHGCVKAVWIPESNLPEEYRVGLFAEQQKHFDTWIRFSNGNPSKLHDPDGDADVRGMAMKVLNVDQASSGNQDFVMLTSSRFFSKDAEDYFQLQLAVKAGGLKQAAYFLKNPTNGVIILKALKKIDTPLQGHYFDPVPFKLGMTSMKFKAEPCNEVSHAPFDKKEKDFLRQNLVKDLANEGACFNFYVQPNREPQKNNIEDTRLEWDEKVSPFFKVARIQIPSQTGIDSEKQWNLCENMSFNPWHSQEVIRPLGQINRIRKIVYDGVSQYRLKQNGIEQKEPRSLEPCEDPQTESLCH